MMLPDGPRGGTFKEEMGTSPSPTHGVGRPTSITGKQYFRMSQREVRTDLLGRD